MKKIRRRDFIRKSLLAGSAAFIGPGLIKSFGQVSSKTTNPDIVTIDGDDIPSNMLRLLEPLGGIRQFVKPGDTVGILVNSPWKNPGYFTKPDIALEIAKLSLEAGATGIVCFKPVPAGYWEKAINPERYSSIVPDFTYGSDRETVDIPGGKSLKSAEIFRSFREVDVFISIPVAKHHAGTIFSGNLKGLMGVSSSYTNKHMHSPDGQYTYDNQEYLAQCIADLALLRKPDLCIVDATECAVTNGPAGPGETTSPNKIIAGTDPLALDVFAAGLIGFAPSDILTFKYAHEHGLGKIDTDAMTLVYL